MRHMVLVNKTFRAHNETLEARRVARSIGGEVRSLAMRPPLPRRASGRRPWGIGFGGVGGRTHQPATHRVSRAQIKRMK